MILLELLATSLASKSTILENTARRNGSAISAPSDTPCNPIGKPIPRPVVLGNIDAIVALSSQGNNT